MQTRTRLVRHENNYLKSVLESVLSVVELDEGIRLIHRLHNIVIDGMSNVVRQEFRCFSM